MEGFVVVFIVGYLVAGLIVGGFSAYVAGAKNRSPIDWFLLGVFFNILSLVALVALPKGTNDDDEDTQEDPAEEEAPKLIVPPAARSSAARAAADRRGPSRRTASREERRRRSSARRARRRRIYMIGGLIIALALIAGLALPSFGIVNTTTDVPQAEPSAGTQLAVQLGDTLEPGETAVYDTDPPTSGPSWAEGAPWGVHTEQQPNEAVVRNLRNGGIAFNYALADETAVADLRAFVESLDGYPDCYVMQPHSGVTDGSVSLAAWGWTDTAAPGDTAAMQDFVDDHRADSPDSPDGGGCGGGSGA